VRDNQLGRGTHGCFLRTDAEWLSFAEERGRVRSEKTAKRGEDGMSYLDWPAPEEIIQMMVEVLLTQCLGDYGAAHATVDGYREHEYCPEGSAMGIIRGLMVWSTDETANAHEAIERHRQMRFGW
jgi:hypothetical protein